MSQVIKIKRSTGTPLTEGVSALNFGELAVTKIGGLAKFFIGDENDLAKEIAGDSFAKLASPALTGVPTAPTATAGTSTTQLATTAFVQTAIGNNFDGLSYKTAVRAASTANVDIANDLEDGDSLDGVTLATGDRVLLKDQTAGEENGIYVVAASGAASRSADADSSAEVTPGMSVFVSEGSVNGDQRWTLSTDAPITLDTTELVFVQTSGTGQITAGNGLSKSGNTLDVNVDDSSIEINTDALRVKALGITNAMLAGSIADSKLSTITTANKVSGSAVQLASGSAISDNSGLQVNVDGSTLEVNTGSIRVKDSGITAAKIAASAVGNGLTGGAGTALAVLSDATGGANLAKVVNVSSNGVAIKVDSASIVENGSGQLEVDTIDCGTF